MFLLDKSYSITLDVNIEFIRSSFEIIEDISVENELTTLLLTICLLPF